MASASVISLKLTLHHLLNSSQVSLIPTEILETAYEQSKSIEDTLRRLSTSSKQKRVASLEGRIREAARIFELVLGSHIAHQIETHPPISSSIDLQYLKQEVDSFVQNLKKMEEEYIKELDYKLAKERQDDHEKKSKMVGVADEFCEVKDLLTSNEAVAGAQVISLVGMAGIGKTAFADEICEDEDVRKSFDCHAWVTVGEQYELENVRKDILATVNSDFKEDGNIAQQLYQSLKDKRYLIVLDDVWRKEVWDDLERLFPENDRGNYVLLTTRLQKVALHASKSMDHIVQFGLLDEEESWILLCSKVFENKLCPPELEKYGKKIAENCEGLPLTIVTVAQLLSKSEAEWTLDYWSAVATNPQHPLFVAAYDRVSEVLRPSYKNLSDHLKKFFLYMGVFPQRYEIPLSKLVLLVTAEGFLEPNKHKTSRELDYMVNCLNELRSNNVVMLHQKNPIWYLISTAGIKTCRLHTSFWQMCNREARKTNFFYVLRSYKDGLADGIRRQTKLCIHNNILLGLKDVFDSIQENCKSTARSLLCFGPYYPYPVPICFGLGSLNILDVLTIRFYNFPVQVQELIQLKYLALTCNRKLPKSISRLLNLEFLIVRQHLSIKSSRDPSYLPIEIWDMKKLKHIHVMGSDLRDLCGTPLPSLLTLLGVTAHCCTKGIFKRTPHLKKLGVRIELAPYAAEPLSCFDHISHLKELESLKCVVVYQDFGSEFVPPPAPPPMFSTSLKRLSLSGFGYPWKDMTVIASLLNLEVLKLQNNAFRGAMWETRENEFLKLKILVIEDNDLVQWKVGRGSFKWLTCLSIKHCYKLVTLNLEFGIFLSMIELVDCNPSAEAYVKKIRDAEESKGYTVPDVYVHASWYDGHLQTQGTTLSKRKESSSIQYLALYNKHDTYPNARAGLE